jgi:hypothetical protein
MMLPTHRIVIAGAREGEGAEVVYVELGEAEGNEDDQGFPAYASDAEREGKAPSWRFTKGGWYREGRLVHRVFKVFATAALRDEASRAARLIEWKGLRWRASTRTGAGVRVQTVETLFIPRWDIAGVVVAERGDRFVGGEKAVWIASKSAAAASHMVLDLRGT